MMMRLAYLAVCATALQPTRRRQTRTRLQIAVESAAAGAAASAFLVGGGIGGGASARGPRHASIGGSKPAPAQRPERAWKRHSSS